MKLEGSAVYVTVALVQGVLADVKVFASEYDAKDEVKCWRKNTIGSKTPSKEKLEHYAGEGTEILLIAKDIEYFRYLRTQKTGKIKELTCT